MHSFLRGALFELRKNAAIIVGTSMIAPMQAKLRAVAPKGLWESLLVKGTKATKSPVK